MMKNLWKFLLLLVILSCSSNDNLVQVGEEQEPNSNALEIPISTVNYDTMSNWYYHPNQSFNFLQNYDLDIAVIDENLNTNSVVEITNNATINTGIDVFWVHPTHLQNPPTNPTTIAISDQDTNFIALSILAQGSQVWPVFCTKIQTSIAFLLLKQFSHGGRKGNRTFRSLF